jgi:FKBP-type peptidyl-prolyl cis-trans isomerase
LAAKCELLAAERDRLKLIADKAEAKRLKDNARGRAKTRDAAAYRQQQEAEEAKKAEVLKLSGDLVYMTQTGNVYEWDADAEVRGDYVGRLVKDEFDTLSIDYDAVEVV